MCLVQDKSRETVTPIYFAEVVEFSTVDSEVISTEDLISQREHNVETTSIQRWLNVESALIQHCVPAGMS